jgi:hypothetical protein
LTGVNYEHSRFTKHAYDASKPYGGLTTVPRQYPIISTFLQNGDVIHEISDPLGYYRYTIRSGTFVVASEDVHSGGTAGVNSSCQLY